jgi:hypothetical protein
VDDTVDDNFDDSSGADDSNLVDDLADDTDGKDGMTASDVDAPEATTWTRPNSTGVPSVDAAIEELARLDELPTGEHVGVYEGLHRQLQDALADLDGS